MSAASVPIRTHVVRTGEVAVALPLESAFPLFTPVGEKLWAAGWDPEFHHPAEGGAVEGAVFSTRGDDGRATHWIVVDWAPEEHRVRYARVTPGLRAGTVTVQCRAIGDGATVATVTYDLVALDADGDAELAGWTDDWYREFLRGWEREIAAAIASPVSQSAA